MRLSVNTSIYDGYHLSTILKSIKKCGFHYFELAYNQGYVSNLTEDLFSDEHANYVNELKEKYNLSTLALGCTTDLSVDNITDIFIPRLYFARKIGAKYINVCTTKKEHKHKMLENLITLKPILEETGCILCLENGGDYNFNAFITIDDGIEILNYLGKDYFSINFDPGNMFTYDKGLNVINQSLKSIPYVKYFHIKDVTIYDNKFKFLSIGKGEIDYKKIISSLKDKDIPCSLEIPLRMYRNLDSTPRRFSYKVELSLIEETLIKSREYIENI